MQRSTIGTSISWSPVMMALGITLAVVGQFVVPLAESGDAWHWIQHGMLFTGGLVTGFALARWIVQQSGSRA